MIAFETIMPNKELKVKFSSKRIEGTTGRQSFELGQQLSLGEWNETTVICGGKKLDSKAKSSMPGSNKRGPSDLIECPREKRQRMDRGVSLQCSTILKKLMSHPANWPFKKPVDPVELNIPDYFSIISKPMDLGTIKSKLEKNIYFGAGEFAADVRLTFSNAMLYNPPDNVVHKMAVELERFFESRWKTLEDKWNRDSSKVGQGKFSSGRTKETKDTGQNIHNTPPLQNNSLFKTSMSSTEKVRRSCDGRDVEIAKTAQKCTQKLSGKEFVKGTDNGSRHSYGSVNAKSPLSPIARKCGRCGSTTCQCSISCNSTHASSSDLSVQRSLDRDHRLCGVDASRQAQLAKTIQKCTQKISGKEIHKGIDNGSRHSCGSVNAKPSSSPIARKCGRCGSITCQCNSCDSAHTSSNDLSVQRSLDRDHRLCGADISRQAKSTSVSQLSKSDPDSDGAVSALDDENTCLSSQFTAPAIDAASQGGWSAPDFAVQLSPKKALRAALLKSRFAETILKAQHKTLLDHGDKADPLKMQQEKQRLERRQREETARIEAQIREAEAALRRKEEVECKLQRERQREAARVALQKMEKTVDFEENMMIQKELEMLFGCSVSSRLLHGSFTRTQLEQLGLFIKDDDDDEEGLDFDGEEGEIFS
ncbi:transcription factor GTE12-like isoform X1 [Castanea sativa]|uniref:transcription factor GTE12-like isoform X1 n=1 Tax=Castanea sativa TaxID=21020 RepID=UPI003F64CFA8